MAFLNKGQAHNIGTNGEFKVLDWFNDKKNSISIRNRLEKILGRQIHNEFNFVLLGGTSNRPDIVDIENNINISVKSKKYDANSGYHGTFDLINTTINNVYSDIDTDNLNDSYVSNIQHWESDEKKSILELLQNYKDKIEKIDRNIDKNSFKNVINEEINKIINNIDYTTINLLFQKIFEKERDTVDVIRDYINSPDEDILEDDIHFLDTMWIRKEFEKLDQNTTYETKNSSIRLKNTDGSNSVFRLRVVLNNGTEALMRNLGIIEQQKGKNSSSVLTFKIQVDDVQKIVDNYSVSSIKFTKKNIFIR
ncbi:hypothetical protein E1I18_00985 [Mycoplasmopsis mucosicanis]|uniref:Uncharacterized protein n=1 Tax=Mycoplasmopsis mucosicanis TaxID=458208 RepID=A0A507SY09_9BACT|nr:hypothetical protein [Mycoplasmopsis mucosicanis]TQC54018.1 hypothetical protein E1I18_00985 [Mycoplasmopsis mucosicanis]